MNARARVGPNSMTCRSLSLFQEVLSSWHEVEHIEVYIAE